MKLLSTEYADLSFCFVAFFQSACWSPKGDILLFTTENQPVIFSLTFSDIVDGTAPVNGGSQTAVACADLSEVVLETDDETDIK